MKLGLSIGYSGARLSIPVELIQHARREFAVVGGEALISAAGAVHQ